MNAPRLLSLVDEFLDTLHLVLYTCTNREVSPARHRHAGAASYSLSANLGDLSMPLDWTDEQNDAIVADYFAMLADDVAERPYNKAPHNRTLQVQVDRPRSSIEYKHQNISAILKGLGETWIPGYKPAFNFQASLADAVVRRLDRHQDWLTPSARAEFGPSPSAFREATALWIGPPPTLTGMSPTLLRWLSGNAPKQGSNRKLPVAKKDGDTRFYDKDELLAFDAWLKLPWPSKGKARPAIPVGIHREIKEEAGGACAICHGHKDTCEAAHIDPVAKSKNNHPENLIWLCANHHTAYDKGLFGPAEGDEDFVAAYKTVLRRYRLTLWSTQHEVSHTLFILLDNCAQLEVQLAAAKTKDQVGAVTVLAEAILAKLPKLAPVSTADPNYEAYKSIAADVAAVSQGDKPLARKLNTAKKARANYAAALGLVQCPLCNGTGHHDGMDCPVCGGEREVDGHYASRVDLAQYEKVDCPVCDGEETVHGTPCPACAGEARMDRRFADQIDVRNYQKVECPLCDGTGRRYGDDCPACGGGGEVDRRDLEAIDLRQYEEVECPLCEGSGRHDGNECPVCHGDRRLEKRFADQVDLRGYERVRCPVCDGTGTHGGRDCPLCGGEREIDQRDLDSLDLRDYELVECPVCEGRKTVHGDDCPACDGEGEMERRHADALDPRDYQ